MPEIVISPLLNGHIDPISLLRPVGTFHFETTKESFFLNGCVFKVVDDDFLFAFGYKDSKIICQRNNYINEINTEHISDFNEPVLVALRWQNDSFTLSCYTKSEKIDNCIQTNLISPPMKLLTWAQKQNLVHIIQFKTETQFIEKVYSCLNSIQEKVNQIGVNGFWDITYDGKKVRTRRPKLEPDVHPIIHNLIADQMLVSGIEIVPEYHTGVGNLDFLFLGVVENIGTVKICVEFKNAHSDDIYHGLEEQLPAYMKNCKTNHGAYCVLFYKGNWFNEPIGLTLKELRNKLLLKRRESLEPLLENVRLFIFNLAKPESASEKK